MPPHSVLNTVLIFFSCFVIGWLFDFKKTKQSNRVPLFLLNNNRVEHNVILAHAIFFFSTTSRLKTEANYFVLNFAL